jgi:DNA-binding transcriptional ArsR family regulator
MDEIVAQIARTIACRVRLRMLAQLTTAGELAPTALARALHLPIDAVSAHLRRLSAAGLIQRRRSGTWSYCVASSPAAAGTLPARIAAWLYQALKSPKRAPATGAGARNHTPDLTELQQRQHTVIFEAATAFTHVRRLQLIRRLDGQVTVTAAALTEQLHMSPAALSRHMAKLIRRGYVEVAPMHAVLAYRLTRRCRTPLHEKLFQCVRTEWPAP